MCPTACVYYGLPSSLSYRLSTCCSYISCLSTRLSALWRTYRLPHACLPVCQSAIHPVRLPACLVILSVWRLSPCLCCYRMSAIYALTLQPVCSKGCLWWKGYLLCWLPVSSACVVACLLHYYTGCLPANLLVCAYTCLLCSNNLSDRLSVEVFKVP
jgi:hypothetical protein